MAAISSRTASAAPSGTISDAESGPGPLAPPDRVLDRDLAGLDDRALLDIVRLSPRASQRRAAAGELLVSRHQGLVRSCVRRYLSSPEPAEDLMQVGYVGLLKAIGNFDPAADCSLATYAGPCISGEIKRHFRGQALAGPCQAPGAGPGPGSPCGDLAADPGTGPHPGRLRPGPAPGSQRG